MNILILGSGGREHAFGQLLKTKDHQLYFAPGNGGTSALGTNLPLDALDFNGIAEAALLHQIDMILPCSEDPLVAGITDYFESHRSLSHISLIGPDKYSSALEGSKDFAKSFMKKYGIPTANYETFSKESIEQGKKFIRSLAPPYVLKADGLAAGKGVLILNNSEEACQELENMLNGKFGNASNKVVVEEFLKGIEISVFAVSDGESWKFLGSAKDYKRIGEGDKGLNTGGMGAVSPVPFADEAFLEKVRVQIAEPTFSALKNEGHPFVGFLFMGLMNCDGSPKVIEYNVRMGDPETETLFSRLETPLDTILVSMSKKELHLIEIKMNKKTAVTIFTVSGGYPESYEKGKKITLPVVPEDARLFHAGTSANNNQYFTSGGRVIAATCLGNSIEEASLKSIQLAEAIKFEGKFFRRDIGNDLIKETSNEPA